MKITFQMDECIVEFEFVYQRITGFEEDQTEEANNDDDAEDSDGSEASQELEDDDDAEDSDGSKAPQNVVRRQRSLLSIRKQELEQKNEAYVSRAINLVNFIWEAMNDDAFKSGIQANNVYYSEQAGEEGMILVVYDHFEVIEN